MTSRQNLPLSGSSILVTGATGFIGTRLIEMLSQASDPNTPLNITPLIRNRTRALPDCLFPWKDDNSLKIMFGDLTEPRSLAFGDMFFDTVFHLAAATPEVSRRQSSAKELNYQGSKNLFDAVKEKTRHLIYVSGVSGLKPDKQETVVNEKSQRSSDSKYVKFRIMAEQFLRDNCMDRGIDFSVVYFPEIVYGNGGSFKKYFLEPIENGKFRIPGSGDYFTNVIHIDDAAEILITTASRLEMRNNSFIAADSLPVKFKDFVTFVAESLNAKIPGCVPLILAKAVAGSDLIQMLTRSVKVSNEKISKFYEFKYPTYRTGIPDVVGKFKSKQ